MLNLLSNAWTLAPDERTGVLPPSGTNRRDAAKKPRRGLDKRRGRPPA